MQNAVGSRVGIKLEHFTTQQLLVASKLGGGGGRGGSMTGLGFRV